MDSDTIREAREAYNRAQDQATEKYEAAREIARHALLSAIEHGGREDDVTRCRQQLREIIHTYDDEMFTADRIFQARLNEGKGAR